jgi:hypothetical protein
MLLLGAENALFTKINKLCNLNSNVKYLIARNLSSLVLMLATNDVI